MRLDASLARTAITIALFTALSNVLNVWWSIGLTLLAFVVIDFFGFMLKEDTTRLLEEGSKLIVITVKNSLDNTEKMFMLTDDDYTNIRNKKRSEVFEDLKNEIKSSGIGNTKIYLQSNSVVNDERADRIKELLYVQNELDKEFNYDK